MKKYKTTGKFSRIDVVEISRETEHCVWVRGIRRSKTGYQSFHDTYDEAKAHIVGQLRHDLQAAKRRVEDLRDRLAKANQL